MTNKICVYAICKNEIQFAKKWIDSMSEADYIVVLDTGSTDGTYEFLQHDPRITRVEQKVIKPWRFDVARNESMKLVPDDANILFCTDFDELLEPGWGDLVRSSWKEDTERGKYMYAWSHTVNGEGGVTFIYDKMHNRNYHWVFPVHEVLLNIHGNTIAEKSHLDPNHVVNFGDKVYLHHYPDLSKSRSSYLDLLKLRVQENPNEPYSHYLLGREYGTLQMWDDALKEFEIVLTLPDVIETPLVKYCIYGYMGDIYLIKQNLELAIQYYTKQILEDKTHREPYCCLAEIYNALGMYSTAIGYIEDALQYSYRHYDWSERESVWNEKVYDILSVSYYYLDRIDAGLINAIKAMKLAPNNERIRKNYEALLKKKSEVT